MSVLYKKRVCFMINYLRMCIGINRELREVVVCLVVEVIVFGVFV